jgi:DNA polymerase III subunit delta'
MRNRPILRPQTAFFAHLFMRGFSKRLSAAVLLEPGATMTCMSGFENFWGNSSVSGTLSQMISDSRIPQTILLGGAAGVGKATLVRRFAARLLGDAAKIERDDLSLPGNLDILEQREKLTAEKRGEDPLLFSSHPDFVTFAPDGPLRQISIQQIRALKERAQLKPMRGRWRIFLIDHIDRANEQAANSLLKLLEEPPDHLIVFATAENLYDLLPTIRSRSVIFPMARLGEDEMRDFIRARGLEDGEAHLSLAEGCPGVAVSHDLVKYRERRDLMLSLFECASGTIPFSGWVEASESFSNRKTEKLDLYLGPAYSVLEDLLAVSQGSQNVRNADVAERLARISARVNFRWIEAAGKAVDEIAMLLRRNIQKIIALDAVIIDLRNQLLEVSA